MGPSEGKDVGQALGLDLQPGALSLSDGLAEVVFQ